MCAKEGCHGGHTAGQGGARSRRALGRRREDGYGYDVVRRLRSAGLDEVGDASVYGTLRRLYQAGALTSYVVPSDEGPHRKYYGINAQGRTMLETQGKTWGAFATTMDGLLEQAGVQS
jgi:PadR family transcriptional regulator PadR